MHKMGQNDLLTYMFISSLCWLSNLTVLILALTVYGQCMVTVANFTMVASGTVILKHLSALGELNPNFSAESPASLPLEYHP